MVTKKTQLKDIYYIEIVEEKSQKILYENFVKLENGKLYSVDTNTKTQLILFNFKDLINADFKFHSPTKSYVLKEMRGAVCEPMADTHSTSICLKELSTKFQIINFEFYNGYIKCPCEKK